MGLEKRWIILFLVVLPLISGQAIQDVIKSIQENVIKGNITCSVTVANRQLDRCDVHPTVGNVPEGTICTFTASEGTVDTFVCDQGYLIYIRHGETGIETGPNREKRWGWIVGIVVATIIVCAAICKRKQVGQEGTVNMPPTIKCPAKQDHVANKLEDKIKVTWAEPDAKDPEGKLKDVEIIRGEKSGSMFGDGTHTIIYKATDDHGYSATCSFVINVVVIYCYYGSNLHLENGRALCATPALYGTDCSFTCNSGFKLSHTTPVTCEDNGNNGKWTDNNELSCQRKECSSPGPVCNGKYLCTKGNYFESVCYPVCNDGYSTEVTRSLTCNGDTWDGVDTILPCKDVKPPDVTCPPDIHVFADGSGTAIVSWQDPIASDNSESNNCGEGASITIQQVTRYNKDTAFDIGYHLIKYEASDLSQNTQTCQFAVIVEELSCEPFVVEDQFLLTQCPGGFSLGSTCSFRCFLSYEMVGSSNVTCEKDPVDKNKAYWAWQNGSETFCEKLTCPDLPAPAGGALACSSALGNTICTMSCSEDYLVAKGTPREYVCNDEQVWIQGIPPNCTDRVHPANAISPGELFYYYSGDCSDMNVQEGIKQNFVEVMKNLEGGEGWDNICPEYCTVDGVTVTCGPLNGRRRRRRSFPYHSLSKRSTSEITITFKIKSKWQQTKDLWGNDDDMKLLSSYIKNQVSNGSFDVAGTSIGNINFGWIEMSCPTGLEPKYDNDAKCEGCSPGKYLNGGNCHKCEKGTFQDIEFQTNCTHCPNGKSTGGTGSTSLEQCKNRCLPGTYSTSGVEPCTPCPLGQYQPESEKTSCLLCPPLKYTSSTGSTNATECHVMDLAFEKKDSVVMLDALTVDLNSFTAGMWMKCASGNNTGIFMSFANLNVTFGNEIIIALPSEIYSKSDINNFDTSKWINIAIAVDGPTKTVKVSGNGVQIVSLNLTSATTDEMTAPKGSRLILQSKSIGCILSGFYTVKNTLSQSILESNSKVCLSLVPNTLYNMDSIYRADRVGTQLPETRCDAIDECLSSPCGAGNICINEQGRFSCNCTRGYSGTTCQVPPDFCINNSCHGDSTCVSNFNNYTCLCSVDFTGARCENEIVHGNWGSWVQTSECSVTCNGGLKTRERFCNDPEPDIHGKDCNGNHTSTVVCNEQKCPECKPSYTIKQFKNNLNCTTSSDSISCVVTCQPGYSFVKGNFPLDEYVCGPGTSYEWPAHPPPCASVHRALSLSTSTSVNYQVDCSSEESFSSTLSSGLNQLQCVSNGTCDVSTSVSGCIGSSRKRRSLTNVQVTINLVSDLTSVGDLKLDDFYANNIVSPGLLEMITIYTDMDKSIYQMNSTDVLTVDDNGVLYNADLSSFSFTSNATCPNGKVEEDLMCVNCPTGTYWNAGLCVMCSEGTYQSQSGQLMCLQCPTGFSTRYVGSQNESDCSIPSNSTEESKTSEDQSKDKDEGEHKIIILVVLGAGALVVVAVVVTIIIKKRHNRNKRMRLNLGSTRSIQSVGSASKVYPEIVDDLSGTTIPRYVSIPPKSGKL